MRSRLLLLIGLALAALPAAAATLYKYRDANGRWVFTDKAPTGAVTELSAAPQLITERNWRVGLGFRGSQLWASNSLAGPVTISWQWHDRAGQLHQRQVSVAAFGETPLATAPDASRFQWSYTPGREHAAAPAIGVIPTPFGRGRFLITQGFHGTATHGTDPVHTYAVDIALPEGEPVLAVAAGKVMELEIDFSRAGYSAAFADEANFVRVLHADGSTAIYAHLRPGATVALGQQVAVGEVLGYAGNTGYSSGPHLHFALQANIGGALQALPFEFAGGGVPTTGAWLGR